MQKRPNPYYIQSASPDQNGPGPTQAKSQVDPNQNIERSRPPNHSNQNCPGSARRGSARPGLAPPSQVSARPGPARTWPGAQASAWPGLARWNANAQRTVAGDLAESVPPRRGPKTCRRLALAAATERWVSVPAGARRRIPMRPAAGGLECEAPPVGPAESHVPLHSALRHRRAWVAVAAQQAWQLPGVRGACRHTSLGQS